MEKVTKVNVDYEKSDTVETQGNKDVISRYLIRGYREKENRNGYLVLFKPSKVVVELTNSSGSAKFNIKNEVLSFYRREKISAKLIAEFENDIEKGNIIFEMNEGGTEYRMMRKEDTPI